MYQILEDQLYHSSKVWFYLNILSGISFYSHHRYFHIQYNYYSRNNLYFSVYKNYLLLQSILISLIILSLIFLFFIFLSIKRFLMLLIMFSSDWFCVFDLLSFFPLSYAVCLGVSVLKWPTTLFLIASGM